MKKLLGMILMVVVIASLTACGENKQEVTSENVVESIVESENMDVKKNESIEESLGIREDGIGEVVALSDDEKSYMQAQTTNSWLEMNQTEKGELVSLVGRHLEETKNYIVEDYDDLVAMLDHQMETYYRNKVDAGVFETVCDILDIE